MFGDSGCGARNRTAINSAPCPCPILKHFCTGASVASLSTDHARAMQVSTAIFFELSGGSEDATRTEGDRLLDLQGCELGEYKPPTCCLVGYCRYYS